MINGNFSNLKINESEMIKLLNNLSDTQDKPSENNLDSGIGYSTNNNASLMINQNKKCYDNNLLNINENLIAEKTDSDLIFTKNYTN